LVDVGDGSGEAQVERPKNPHIPIAEGNRRRKREAQQYVSLDAYQKQLEREHARRRKLTCSPRS
jgi:hypothetical protein